VIFAPVMKFLELEVRRTGSGNRVAYHHAHWTRDGAPLLDLLGAVIDHIEAFSAGGASDMDNLATACNKCNGRKSAATLAKWEGRPTERPLRVVRNRVLIAGLGRLHDAVQRKIATGLVDPDAPSLHLLIGMHADFTIGSRIQIPNLPIEIDRLSRRTEVAASLRHKIGHLAADRRLLVQRVAALEGLEFGIEIIQPGQDVVDLIVGCDLAVNLPGFRCACAELFEPSADLRAELARVGGNILVILGRRRPRLGLRERRVNDS
jgi:hypothetical protein